MRKRILIVDDEPEIRELLAGVLAEHGYDVQALESGEEAIEAARLRTVDIVVLDVRMRGIDGIETYHQLKKINPYMRAIIMTAFYKEREIEACMCKGVDVFLHKPFELAELFSIIDDIETHIQEAG